jgi:ATP-dependent DNA helicase RecQ
MTQTRKQGVSAYLIFHDRTLAEIAAAQPADLDGLGALAGIGARKLERYGPALLDLVRG